MRTGTITHYATDMEEDIIKAEDGGEFVFERPSWLHMQYEPQSGDEVTFELEGLVATNVAIFAPNQNHWA